jgi:hypothetical protein
MAITQKRLAGPAQLTASSAIYYTVPISTTTIVKQIILTNTTAAAKTVTVRLKPLGVAEAATHDIISAMSLAANESTANATNSDQLAALCSSATSVNITVVGIEEV